MYDDTNEPVRVAAGILKKDDQVLICQRGINRRYGLRWEFPGGKAYPGEALSECLVRELEEELGITPTQYKELRTLQADYPDGGRFLITFFLVHAYEGQLQNRVFEKIEWVPLSRIRSYDLLEGSLPILQYL
ncbi:MAG: (deoxy)nucleoside triphosphate pyrophosphohydrolase [Bacteroidota bacterium]|nr:(deoxy)nucleoside triphosphate pyrophosphohydrolase [Bacteroidota bacterium]